MLFTHFLYQKIMPDQYQKLKTVTYTLCNQQCFVEAASVAAVKMEMMPEKWLCVLSGRHTFLPCVNFHAERILQKWLKTMNKTNEYLDWGLKDNVIIATLMFGWWVVRKLQTKGLFCRRKCFILMHKIILYMQRKIKTFTMYYVLS